MSKISFEEAMTWDQFFAFLKARWVFFSTVLSLTLTVSSYGGYYVFNLILPTKVEVRVVRVPERSERVVEKVVPIRTTALSFEQRRDLARLKELRNANLKPAYRNAVLKVTLGDAYGPLKARIVKASSCRSTRYRRTRRRRYRRRKKKSFRRFLRYAKKGCRQKQ